MTNDQAPMTHEESALLYSPIGLWSLVIGHSGDAL